jgi:hypothetical protein
MSLLRIAASLLLLTAASTTAHAQPSAAEPTPPPSDSDTAVLGTLKLWTFDEDSLGLVGVQYRRAVSPVLAITVEGATNLTGIQEEPLAFNAVFAGLKARLSQSNTRPYLAGKLGVLPDDGLDDLWGLWSVGAGIEASVGDSGLEIDLGAGVVGAFGESETVNELTLAIGQRF